VEREEAVQGKGELVRRDSEIEASEIEHILV